MIHELTSFASSLSGVELKMHCVTLFQPHAGSVLLNGNLLRFVRMITKLMSYVSVYFIALTNFMMLTLHSLNGVNNTVSWFCSRFRLDKLGSTNVTYILCIYFYLIIPHILWKRFKVSGDDRYIESVHHQS